MWYDELSSQIDRKIASNIIEMGLAKSIDDLMDIRVANDTLRLVQSWLTRQRSSEQQRELASELEWMDSGLTDEPAMEQQEDATGIAHGRAFE